MSFIVDDGELLIRVLAKVLERLIETNTNGSKRSLETTKFHSSYAPDVSIFSYLERIRKYAKCNDSCFIAALIYIDRLIELQNFVLSPLNVHRLLITSVMIAAKFFEDDFFKNTYYAKLGGISGSEINCLELELLRLLNFGLHIQPEVFSKYQLELRNFVGSLDLTIPLSPSPSLASPSASSTSTPLSTISTPLSTTSSLSWNQLQQQQALSSILSPPISFPPLNVSIPAPSPYSSVPSSSTMVMPLMMMSGVGVGMNMGPIGMSMALPHPQPPSAHSSSYSQQQQLSISLPASISPNSFHNIGGLGLGVSHPYQFTPSTPHSQQSQAFFPQQQPSSSTPCSNFGFSGFDSSPTFPFHSTPQLQLQNSHIHNQPASHQQQTPLRPQFSQQPFQIPSPYPNPYRSTPQHGSHSVPSTYSVSPPPPPRSYSSTHPSNLDHLSLFQSQPQQHLPSHILLDEQFRSAQYALSSQPTTHYPSHPQSLHYVQQNISPMNMNQFDPSPRSTSSPTLWTPHSFQPGSQGKNRFHSDPRQDQSYLQTQQNRRKPDMPYPSHPSQQPSNYSFPDSSTPFPHQHHMSSYSPHPHPHLSLPLTLPLQADPRSSSLPHYPHPTTTSHYPLQHQQIVY